MDAVPGAGRATLELGQKPYANPKAKSPVHQAQLRCVEAAYQFLLDLRDAWCADTGRRCDAQRESVEALPRRRRRQLAAQPFNADQRLKQIKEKQRQINQRRSTCASKTTKRFVSM